MSADLSKTSEQKIWHASGTRPGELVVAAVEVGGRLRENAHRRKDRETFREVR